MTNSHKQVIDNLYYDRVEEYTAWTDYYHDYNLAKRFYKSVDQQCYYAYVRKESDQFDRIFIKIVKNGVTTYYYAAQELRETPELIELFKHII